MEYDFDRVYDRRGTDSSKWGRVDPDVLPMPVADMDFPAPEPVRRALLERVEHGFYGYGLATEDFHEAFTSRLKRRYGWDVAHESLVPIPGVIPGFNMGLRALTSPGDGVLVQLPAYPPILNANGHHGLVRQDAFLVRGDSGRYEIDWASLEAAIDETTRVFLLCNPHNPIGKVYARAELERLSEIVERRGARVFSDEIHAPLVYDGGRHVPYASVSDAAARHTVTSTSASKSWNLAGLKTAQIIFSNAADLAVWQEKGTFKEHGATPLGVVANTVAYRDCLPWLADVLGYLDGNRVLLSQLVAQYLPGASFVMPEGTYLAFIDCNALDLGGFGGTPAEFFAERAGVVLTEGGLCGDAGTGWVRLNFATPAPILRRIVAAMGAALRMQ